MLWWFQEFTLRLLLDKRGNILGFTKTFLIMWRVTPFLLQRSCQLVHFQTLNRADVRSSLIKAETCRCVWRQLVIMLEGDWKRKRTQWEFNFTLHFYKRVVVFSVHSMWSWVSFLKPTVKGLLWSVGSLEVQRLIQTSKTSKVNHWLTQWIRNECSILCR